MGASQRLGLELGGEPAVPEMMRLARQAEDWGVESVWLTETRFTRDGVTTAAAVIAATQRVRVGTAVLNPFTRGAALSAVTTATLDEMSGGRFVFGIGPGSPTVLARQGYAFERPLARMSETVSVVRRLLRGERVVLDERSAEAGGVTLGFTPFRPVVPVYYGVTGPKALALTGQEADGVILNGFTSLPYTVRAVRIVREAAIAAGRDPAEVEIGGSIVVSVDPDRQKARDAIRPMVATYLGAFPNIARESGVDADSLDAIAAAYKTGGAEAATPLVEDSVVDFLTCTGTVDDVCAGIEERRKAGVELPIVGFSQPEMISYLPAMLTSA